MATASKHGDRRPQLALLGALVVAGGLALSFSWAMWLLAAVAAVLAVRALAYVLGARASMADPDAPRPAGAEGGGTPPGEAADGGR
jgi:hypothetical protein